MDKDMTAADIEAADDKGQITEHFRTVSDENARRESFCRLFGEYIGIMQQKCAPGVSERQDDER